MRLDPGDIGDAMADVDYNSGLMLEAIRQLEIEENTIGCQSSPQL